MSQSISTYRPGFPFGDGTDGDLTVSSNATWGSGTPSVPIQSCSGTVNTTALTIAAASTFANGDLVFIHHSRGTTQNTGGWEVNRISSGGGTTTLTMQDNLDYTYTDSGADQSQVIKILEYDDVTLNSGITWTVPAWGGDTGGIMVFAARGAVTISGTITGNGANGTDINDNVQPGDQGGFRGGKTNEGGIGGNGEGTGGDRTALGFTIDGTTSANGNGGGGGPTGGGAGAGAGGGNGAAGSNSAQATGGNAVGTVSLSAILFGGGGGGGGGVNNQGSGANGGAMCVIFAKSFATPTSITLNGGNGGDAGTETNGGGGGGGGSFLLKCQTATLGSSVVTSSGGTATDGGGNGGVGRISIHHSGSVTGTTSPTYNDTTDGTLIEAGGAGAAILAAMI